MNQLQVTNKGLELIAQSKADRSKIIFSKMVLGEGVHPDSQEATTMKAPFITLTIDAVEAINKSIRIRSHFTNATMNESKTLRERGLFAKDEKTNKDILFAYGAGENFESIPPKDGMSISRYETMIIALSQEKVKLHVDVTAGITEEEFRTHTHNGANSEKVKYADLLNKPKTLEADGGNADTVNHISFKVKDSKLMYQSKEIGWQAIEPSIIKSVQRGVSSPRKSSDIIHSPVDVNKSFVLLDGNTVSNNTVYENYHVINRSSSVLTLGNGRSSLSGTCSWQIIEFY